MKGVGWMKNNQNGRITDVDYRKATVVE